MSSNTPRVRSSPIKVTFPPAKVISTGLPLGTAEVTTIGETISKLWISEGHPVNRKTGKRESGGPFHVTHTGPYFKAGNVANIIGGNGLSLKYSGPVIGAFTKSAAIGANYRGTTEEMDSSSMNSDGATAIARVAPTNPTASLSVGLAETFKEGFPTLPGIQSWKAKTRFLKGLGSEYLNYQFGWAPLHSEVQDVVNAARHHRDIMKNYEHNEGKNVHRRFDFSPEIQQWEEELSPANALLGIGGGSTYLSPGNTAATRVVYVRNERRRWFEGCFTYGGPGEADNFSRAIGFGNEADAVYGLNLNPEVLWELTPWSWAVDWFTNAGEVISNISNFALAGLVMRYGYMMEETISTYYTQYGDAPWRIGTPGKYSTMRAGNCARGLQTISRSRVPANPFGFGVGWEGLSPTQLAITAALGITRVL
uniref:Maturation protein n=1 Tax=Leviviridae sp. TaxID=2027243 RepID=A0A514D6B6_9VIRU|nr:MAG: hypothetical protein H3BulkLitter17903_000001 [Leviviridae sp.]